MSDETPQRPLPAVDYLKLPAEGDPYLEGQKCKACSAIYLGERRQCSKCSARDLPGIETPYISAIVDLEGGGTVKGNLIGVDPDPEKIQMGMSVEVVYKDALGRKDKEGNSYISYFFQPADAA
jgi:uncharacterized OB-fold protein